MRQICLAFICGFGLIFAQDVTLCAFKDIYHQIYNGQNISDMGILLDPDTVQCIVGKHYCFTMWDIKNNQSIIKQGCWTNPAGQQCNNKECISLVEDNKLPKSLFCCCSGTFCNRKYRYVYINVTKTLKFSKSNTLNTSHRKHNLPLYITIGVISFFILSTVVYILTKCMYARYHAKLKKDLYNSTKQAFNIVSSDVLSRIELIEILDRGRYGIIWKGRVKSQTTDGSALLSNTEANQNSQIVVVKVYKQAYLAYYQNEKLIYTLPCMKHANILNFHGFREFKLAPNVSPEYWLVFDYMSEGSLQTYLQNNILTIQQFLNILETIIKGISHLQKLIYKDNLCKPPIAHRDLNTRNILISEAGNKCVICDLGFAYPLVNSHSMTHNGLTQGKLPKIPNACLNGKDMVRQNQTTVFKEKTLPDVGTIRYMAPEVLEGSINLRDCEAALKQVDIYAFSLVMWEVARRCSHLYKNDCEVLPYELPFQKDVGLHPTFEDMQVIVARNKCRPIFPEEWKTDEAITFFKETVQHCWDQDAEARLSAFCVEERIYELRNLWNVPSTDLIENGSLDLTNHVDGDDGININTNHCGDEITTVIRESNSAMNNTQQNTAIQMSSSTTSSTLNAVFSNNTAEECRALIRKPGTGKDETLLNNNVCAKNQLHKFYKTGLHVNKH